MFFLADLTLLSKPLEKKLVWGYDATDATRWKIPPRRERERNREFWGEKRAKTKRRACSTHSLRYRPSERVEPSWLESSRTWALKSKKEYKSTRGESEKTERTLVESFKNDNTTGQFSSLCLFHLRFTNFSLNFITVKDLIFFFNPFLPFLLRIIHRRCLHCEENDRSDFWFSCLRLKKKKITEKYIFILYVNIYMNSVCVYVSDINARILMWMCVCAWVRALVPVICARTPPVVS